MIIRMTMAATSSIAIITSTTAPLTSKISLWTMVPTMEEAGDGFDYYSNCPRNVHTIPWHEMFTAQERRDTWRGTSDKIAMMIH